MMNNLPKLPLSNRAAVEIAAAFVVFMAVLTLTIWFCWNNFWSPIIGLHRMDLGNAIGFTLSIIIILTVIIGIKETK